MVPDRMTLQMMEKKPAESFRQYAQRWRDISAQVEPPLTKTEITVLFINTLKVPFYDKLVGSATKDFSDIVISGELIENAFKSGRMEGSEGSRKAAPVRKKEPEAHMVGTESRYIPNSYPNQPRPRNYPPSSFYYPPQTPYYQAPHSSYPVYATNNQRPVTTFPQNTLPTQSQPRNEPRPTRPNPERQQFTPIPVSYGELYPKLLEKQLISPHYMAPLKPPYPKWYDPNASCAYHAGNQGHSTENCLAFKRRVQGLIDAGILRFDSASNATENPFPNHTEGNVSTVGKEDEWKDRRCVSEIMTPLQKIWEVLVKKGLLSHSDRIFGGEGQSFCNFHGIVGHDIQSCEDFKRFLQDRMDNKEIKVLNMREDANEREVCVSDSQSSGPSYSADRPLVIYYDTMREPLKPQIVIEVPSPFPYKDNKTVPWRYDVNIVTPKVEKSKATTEDVGEVGHFT
ncbi:hypothetical protein PVK06_033419 [Gossypium arboreum]|uniref:Uncharacterized protein n=1 Tax=Gossypium arboreum TaxID=29729 RepID=A0ABR0NBC4_GOSAR|nr:hypothetical protein PVK06_033419 [Gossypium arboreum]